MEYLYRFIGLLIAGLIWAGLIKLGAWSFGYSAPFFGSWVLGYVISLIIMTPNRR
ncbi:MULTISPECIES: hypothetical protein [unclassified Rhizobium]|uniref:hypothetical protein n=1 Tax=unclassified Rhizobium TaxID=2613769 RepID=UPI00177F9EAC|nr:MULTISPECIES: hypothetical protein [unclassified Rhizobium]MBD8687059.1 hypothetical protein [Rhizobium sp. CFBP 13644]MBD8691138.1 hypothetical protein [Rhizobium sp. CFBP 13717]